VCFDTAADELLVAEAATQVVLQRPDRVKVFGERDAVGGGLGQLRARDALPVLLNAANRVRFLGGRATPDRGLGVARITPLRPSDG